MSSNCPQCSQLIEQDFGVATCPKCGAVLFVDMDGQVQLTKNEPEMPSQEMTPEPVSLPPVEQSFEDNWILDEKPAASIPAGPPASIQDADFSNLENEAIQQDFGQAPVEMGYDPGQDPQTQQDQSGYSQNMEVESGGNHFQMEPQAEVYSESTQEPESEVSNSTPDASLSEDSFELLGDTMQEEPPPAEAPGFTDVAEFANSDQAYGPLSYSVIIENIDTKETREQLLDALSDSKFQWDAKGLMKEIKMGKLKLEGINPVKVSVLIDRLQDVPVKVSWTQHAYS